MNNKKRNLLKNIGIWIITLIWLMPLGWMFVTALKPREETFTLPPRWIGHFSLANFHTVIEKWPFGRWFVNSVIISGAVTIITIFISIFAAYSFARLNWKGRDFVFLLFLASMLIPWQINVVPLYFLMDKLGLLNTYLAVILPIVAMPISVFLLRQFFINIPKELEDAAKIDGCGYVTILWRVIVPISFPAIGALIIYMVIFTWNEFFWSMIALQKSEMFTIPIGLKAIQGAYDIDYNILMAGAALATLPVLFIYLGLQRKIIRSITMSSTGLK